MNIQFFGGRGSGGGKRAGGGGAASSGAAEQSYIQQRAGVIRERLSAEGMSADAIERYIKNEDRADQLERELAAEMSSSSRNHSDNWRRSMQEQINRLRDENTKLRWG